MGVCAISILGGALLALPTIVWVASNGKALYNPQNEALLNLETKRMQK